MTTQNASGNLSQYYMGGPVGLLPGQNMFQTDSTRAGLMAARRSFVGMLNNIFASAPLAVNNPAGVAALDMTTPLPGAMIWLQSAGSSDIQPVPPSTEWLYEVYDLDARDAYLSDPTFVALIISGQRPRILVNGLMNSTPQWSVWEASTDLLPEDHLTDASYIAANPESVFGLANAFNYHAASMADRNLLLMSTPPIQTGQRVLVDADPVNNGFWTVWTYDPLNSEADSSGFVLADLQTYRTTDFYSNADWFAAGYSASAPPVVHYPTEVARNLAENPNPTNLFVQIDNDGTGNWMWTAWDTTNLVWSVVARENGTIALSADLYDASRPVLVNDPPPSDAISIIPNRDGSWELKMIFNALQDDSVLTNLQVNQLFFSMIHFVHAQQDQVPWAFKTSFMNVGGYNTALEQSPVTPPDNTQNLIDYIEEVKPYRVTMRNFTEVYTAFDNAVTHASDFDFPMYYDTTQDKVRWLDINNADDLAIIQSTLPWSDWYANYLKTGYDPANYDAATWNPTRRMNITMVYDRIDHMPVIDHQDYIYDGSTNAFAMAVDVSNAIVEVNVNGVALSSSSFSAAGTDVTITGLTNGQNVEITARQNVTAGAEAARIQQFYNPGLGQPEKNVRQLLGIDFHGDVIGGGNLAGTTTYDLEIDGDADLTDDAYVGARMGQQGLPEELVLLHVNESLRIVVAEDDMTTANATTANGVVALPDHSYALVQSRPSPDLFVPSEIGDYDARPLEDGLYDNLFVQDYSADQDGVQKNILTLRDGAYEYLRWRPTGVLAQNFLANSNTITVTLNPLRTALPIPEPENNKPGAVWIGSERIEYFGLNVVAQTATLTQLRRGTLGSGVSNEVRAVKAFVGDGSTKVFSLPGAISSGVEVMIWQQLYNTAGLPVYTDNYTGYNIPVPKRLGSDYAVTTSGSNALVTFSTAPASGAQIFISRTSGMYAPAGMPVYDGTIRWDIALAAPPPVPGTVLWIETGNCGEFLANATQGLTAFASAGFPVSFNFQCQDSTYNGPVTGSNSIFSYSLVGDVPPGITMGPLEPYVGQTNYGGDPTHIFNGGQNVNFQGSIPISTPTGSYDFSIVATSITGTGTTGIFPIRLTVEAAQADTVSWLGQSDFDQSAGTEFASLGRVQSSQNYNLTYSVTPGSSLPSWLSLDQTTGQPLLYGVLTPTPGEYSFSLRATSAVGSIADAPFNFNILAPGQPDVPTVIWRTPAYLIVPVASDGSINFQFVADNAASFNVETIGLIPAGVSLGADGKLTGTITDDSAVCSDWTAGTFHVAPLAIFAQDSNGNQLGGQFFVGFATQATLTANHVQSGVNSVAPANQNGSSPLNDPFALYVSEGSPQPGGGAITFTGPSTVSAGAGSTFAFRGAGTTNNGSALFSAGNDLPEFLSFFADVNSLDSNGNANGNDWFVVYGTLPTVSQDTQYSFTVHGRNVSTGDVAQQVITLTVTAALGSSPIAAWECPEYIAVPVQPDGSFTFHLSASNASQWTLVSTFFSDPSVFHFDNNGVCTGTLTAQEMQNSVNYDVSNVWNTGIGIDIIVTVTDPNGVDLGGDFYIAFCAIDSLNAANMPYDLNTVCPTGGFFSTGLENPYAFYVGFQDASGGSLPPAPPPTSGGSTVTTTPVNSSNAYYDGPIIGTWDGSTSFNEPMTTTSSSHVLVIIGIENNTTPAPTITSVSANDLSFTKVIEHTGASQTTLSVWIAPLTAQLSSTAITVVASGSFDDATYFMTGLKGVTGIESSQALDTTGGNKPAFTNVAISKPGFLLYAATSNYQDGAGNLPSQNGFAQLTQDATVTDSDNSLWSSLFIASQSVGAATSGQTVPSAITSADTQNEGAVAILLGITAA